MNPPELPIAETNPPPSRLPLYMSGLMCPGAGQFVQRRWFPAIFFSSTFMVCFVLITARALKVIASNFKAAFAFMESQPNKPFATVSLSSLAPPFLIALFLYVISLADTYLAYRRDCAAWTARKFERRFKSVSAAVILLGVSLAGNLLADNPAGLFSAVRSNDLLRVEAILKTSSPTSLEARVGDGITPLHLAATLDLKDMTALLIRKGANPDARTKSGFTPLHWAVSRDAAVSAALLIRSGCDINAAAAKGVTPLHWAASKNATNSVNLLINAGANLDAKTDTGLTPLHWAVMKDANECAVMLAYKSVSEQMQKEPPEKTESDGVDLTEDEMATKETGKPQSAVELPEPELIAQFQTPDVLPMPVASENDLIIPLGHGVDMIFVWVKEMDMWIGKYEITNEQYKRFDANHSSMFRDRFTLNGRYQPVVYTSWNDAKKFCKWLNRDYKARLPLKCEFRLPTGAEWVAFARCGVERKYPWGDALPPTRGNYSDLAAKEKLANWQGLDNYNDGFVVTCPVTDSGVNEWGLYGVGGNVWEWCDDWHDINKKYKARHGGSWDYDDESTLTVEKRGFDSPSTRDDTIGFRLVVAMKKE